MIMFLEIMLALVLIAALCYFVFDIQIVKVAVLIAMPIMIIVVGFFMGIGIHLTNLVFGW